MFGVRVSLKIEQLRVMSNSPFLDVGYQQRRKRIAQRNLHEHNLSTRKYSTCLWSIFGLNSRRRHKNTNRMEWRQWRNILLDRYKNFPLQELFWGIFIDRRHISAVYYFMYLYIIQIKINALFSEFPQISSDFEKSKNPRNNQT